MTDHCPKCNAELQTNPATCYCPVCDKRREASKDALTDLRLEGLAPTSDVRALVELFVRGEINEQELLDCFSKP